MSHDNRVIDAISVYLGTDLWQALKLSEVALITLGLSVNTLKCVVWLRIKSKNDPRF